jgi:hypothetical protein
VYYNDLTSVFNASITFNKYMEQLIPGKGENYASGLSK